MAKYAVLKEFYNSPEYQAFRNRLIAERGPRCETCGKILAESKYCEIDHYPTELTPENVNNPNISLNPDNAKIRCKDCHNERHHRFGHKVEHGIFIVYGPPLSGKTTYVLSHMERGDIVVDMDKLYSAVSLLPEFDKPSGLLRNVLGIRDLLIDNIKTRYGQWNSAWIIGGYPEKFRREQLANELGATLIFCDLSREKCIQRLAIDPERQSRKDEWVLYINKWFENFSQ